MKIGITGHSKGLGEAIYNKLDKIYEVIGFSRTNGYDIQSPNKIIEKLEKDGHIGKDDLARGEKELEKITSDHVAKIDELLKHKEVELLEV